MSPVTYSLDLPGGMLGRGFWLYVWRVTTPKRIKNFACVEVHTRTRNLLVYVKVSPDSIDLVEGFTRDVRQIGHFGTGELEITIKSMTDFDKAKQLFERSYESA